jgi:hypothetical protein
MERVLRRVELVPRRFDDIVSDSAEVLRPLLQEAFNAGKMAGREEAALDIRTKIDDVLSGSATVQPRSAPPSNGTSPSPSAAIPEKRAISGSVKPTIEGMIRAARNGLTVEDIATATGFKINSIRGTLWTLGHDNLAVKRDGRWFSNTSPEGEAEAVGASASH